MEHTNEYDVISHGRMLRDRVRVSAYVDALSAAVTPASVVLDIGTGVGLFAVVAAKLGAKRVIGVEKESSIYIARGIAEENSVGDRVTLIRGNSLDLQLAEPADVVVSDLRGVLPPYRQHLRVIIDAKRRLAHPHAVLIPKRDALLVAVVTSEQAYSSFASPWSEVEGGLNLGFARPFAMNCWSSVRADAGVLLGEAKQWAALNYETLTEEDISGSVVLQLNRPGTAHGLLLWFDAQLAAGIGYSNSPQRPNSAYGQAFFPFEHAVPALSGDQVRVQLRAKAHDGDYLWEWDTTFLREGEKLREFRQSTVRGWVTRPS